jgi:hypothetical protein
MIFLEKILLYLAIYEKYNKYSLIPEITDNEYNFHFYNSGKINKYKYKVIGRHNISEYHDMYTVINDIQHDNIEVDIYNKNYFMMDQYNNYYDKSENLVGYKKNNCYNYVEFLKWLHMSYYYHEIGDYYHIDKTAPTFSQLYAYLKLINYENILIISEYDKKNHYLTSKYEQFINQSIIFDNKYEYIKKYYNNININEDNIKKIIKYNEFKYISKDTLTDIINNIRYMFMYNKKFNYEDY